MRRNEVTGVDVRVDTNTGAAGLMQCCDAAGAGDEAIRIFSVDTALNRVTLDLNVALTITKFFACGNANLFLNQINTGDELCDRVFHLNTGVHFNEVELTVFVEELKRACAAVADLAAAFGTALSDLFNRAAGNADGRRLFDDFLVAALHGTVAFTEPNRIAEVVGENLNLNVTWVFKEFFQINRVVAESGFCFLLGGVDGVNRVG